jgi:hypothetical protein
MMPIAAKAVKYWAAALFASLQNWDLMEPFTELPAASCWLCQQKEHLKVFYFYKI